MNCSLCNASTLAFQHFRQRRYLQCSNCHAILLHPEDLPDAEQERALYLTHNNDVDDPRYQAFVAPITKAIERDFADGRKGLDFGAGTGPVIRKILGHRHTIELYDPFFHPDRHVLEQHYDFIVCSEVMEHFHRPAEEFALLRRLLKPGGKLYCMTKLFSEAVDFQHWHYKNDPTHVFFYHQHSLDYICRQFGFAELQVAERLIIFS